MNKDLFFQHVASARRCDTGLLDIAVQKGIRRAKGDRLDPKKLGGLAAACAVTVSLCLAVNTTPFKAAADEYLLGKSRVAQSGDEAFSVYVSDMANTIIKYLGDD